MTIKYFEVFEQWSEFITKQTPSYQLSKLYKSLRKK